MARFNIKLDYGLLEDLADNCQKLTGSFDDIKSSVTALDKAVLGCEGKSVRALDGKGTEIVENLSDLCDGLEKFSNCIKSFTSDMRSYIDSSGGSMLHINTVDVSWNLSQMINDIIQFEQYARNANPKVYNSGTNSMLQPNNAEETKRALAQIEGKLDGIKDLMIAASTDLAAYDDNFEKFKKIISDFENKDDEYRDKLQELYYEISDASFWSRTSTKVIIGITLVAIAALIVFVAPALVAVGGIVGAAASAIVACSTLTSIATEVIAVGLFTATFAGGIAVFSGEDIEDAAGGGLFDGTVKTVITRGVGTIASSEKYLSYANTILSKTTLSNSTAARETLELVMEEGLSFTGSMLSGAILETSKGHDVNLAKIGIESALDGVLDEGLEFSSKFVTEKLNIPNVQIFRDGKLSVKDLRNAISNGMKIKGLECVKEFASQVSHGIVNNYFDDSKNIENVEDITEDVEVDPSKATESIVKSDLKGKVVDVFKNVVENEVEDITD